MQRLIPSPRNLNWLIGLGCACLMAAALYMETVMGLVPCPLCIFQRLAVVAAGSIAIIGALHNPGGRGVRIYGGLTLAAAAIGAALALRQLYLQSLPADQIPACGPDLDYLLDVFPIVDVIAIVLQGDGSCAEVVWTFLSISIPGWTLIGFVALAALSALQAIKPLR